MPKEKDLTEDIKEEQEVAETAESEEAVKDDASAVEEVAVEETPEADNVKNAEFEKLDSETSEDSIPVTDSDEPVTVQPVQFTSFEGSEYAQGEVNKNLDILMDIKLQLTVELGRTELPVKKVLELTRGSIIELEKVAGEPVELYANGKLVANGEVVVIEDNFGLRITSITDPEDRLKGI